MRNEAQLAAEGAGSVFTASASPLKEAATASSTNATLASPSTAASAAICAGTEWIVEAFGCRAEALRSQASIQAVFDRAVDELSLKPAAPALFHLFPPPGGLTGVLLLLESHLTCHTFPEWGYAAINLYCCRPRPTWNFSERLGELIGATRVTVRELERGRIHSEDAATK